MRRECSRAATPATTPLESTQVLYRGVSCSATTINDILAQLVFGLASPHLSRVERAGVLDVIDRLIRLKIDVGLLKGCRR